jgi:hypothetical protein
MFMPAASVLRPGKQTYVVSGQQWLAGGFLHACPIIVPTASMAKLWETLPPPSNDLGILSPCRKCEQLLRQGLVTFMCFPVAVTGGMLSSCMREMFVPAASVMILMGKLMRLRHAVAGGLLSSCLRNDQAMRIHGEA